jgi:hypothetical protein
MSAITAVASALGVGEPDLSLLPSPIISQAMDDLGLPLRERAAVLLALKRLEGRSDTTGEAKGQAASVTDYFRARDERSIFPWKIDEQRALLQWARVAEEFADANAFDLLRNEFTAQAKASMLSPLEVLLGQYCLFSKDTEFGIFSLMSLILRIPPAQRVACHNWQLAQLMPKATKEAHGTAIAALHVPLFPPACDSLAAFNTKMLTATDATVIGGASATEHALFARGSGLFGGQIEEAAGGSALPVVNFGEHGWGVDVTAIETAFANLQHQVHELRRLKPQQAPKPAVGQRQQQQQQQQQQQPRYQQGQQNQMQQAQSQPWQQRRYRNPRGGDPDTRNDAVDDMLAPSPKPPAGATQRPAQSVQNPQGQPKKSDF